MKFLFFGMIVLMIATAAQASTTRCEFKSPGDDVKLFFDLSKNSFTANELAGTLFGVRGQISVTSDGEGSHTVYHFIADAISPSGNGSDWQPVKPGPYGSLQLFPLTGGAVEATFTRAETITGFCEPSREDL